MYSENMVRSVYFTLDSFKDLFNESMNEVYHTEECQPLFSVGKPAAGSNIVRCINKPKGGIND